MAHLRHLAKPHTASLVLRSRFDFDKEQARLTAALLSNHIARGLCFLDASQSLDPSISAVADYYGFLNLAVATILAYRPKNYLDYKRHGVYDQTSQLQTIALGSRVVGTQRMGAVQLFHQVVAGHPLPERVWKVRELVVPFPHLEMELQDAFKVCPTLVKVVDSLVPDNAPGLHVSRVEFKRLATDQGVRQAPSLRSFLDAAMPSLKGAFEPVRVEKTVAIFDSKRKYQQVDHKTQKSHSSLMLPLINYGGHSVADGITRYFWYVRRGDYPLPALTATLLFSFFLASLARYRPLLSDSLSDSRMHLLVDVFKAESKIIFVRAIRNLLYREEMVIEQHRYA